MPEVARYSQKMPVCCVSFGFSVLKSETDTGRTMLLDYLGGEAGKWQQWRHALCLCHWHGFTVHFPLMLDGILTLYFEVIPLCWTGTTLQQFSNVFCTARWHSNQSMRLFSPQSRFRSVWSWECQIVLSDKPPIVYLYFIFLHMKQLHNDYL